MGRFPLTVLKQKIRTEMGMFALFFLKVNNKNRFIFFIGLQKNPVYNCKLHLLGSRDHGGVVLLVIIIHHRHLQDPGWPFCEPMQHG